MQRPNGCGEVGSGNGRDANPTKRGCTVGGGFRHLAQRKSDASQPVVLVSMTRRPSVNSGQWKPFKWKPSDVCAGDQRTSGGASGQLQTNVDLNMDHTPPSPPSPESVTVRDGHDNPAYSPDKTDV